MPRRVDKLFSWTAGYIPTQAKTSGIPGSIIDGLNVWIWGAGLIESAKGWGSNGSSGGANPLMNVGNTHGGCTGGGTVVDAFGTTWVEGLGTALKGGASLGSASSALQLLRSGSLVPAGLAQPSAPTLTDSGVAGKNDGSYSVAITAIDQITGQESTRSLPSNVQLVTLKKIHIAFPATVASNQTHWGVYCSFKNFGATGPWFHLTDVPISPTSVNLDWYNGELGDLAPIDYFPPPTGTHCFALNNVMNSAGCYGGSGIGPSIPGKPGAYPPDFTVFIPGGGSITSCKATGFAGSVVISTASSVTSVVATNSPITPITVRQIWPTTGFLSGSAWCVIEDEIYGFSGQRGAVRTQGDGPPDTSFAHSMHAFFAANGFTASNTTVGYDPKTDSVVFASGTRAACYYRAGGYWHTPQSISGAVTGATVGGTLLLDVGGGTLNSPELGSGTTGFATFSFEGAGSPEWNHTIVRARASANGTSQLDILTDLDLSTSASGALSLGAGHSQWFHLRIANAKTFSAKWSFTSVAGASLYETLLQVIPHRVTR